MRLKKLVNDINKLPTANYEGRVTAVNGLIVEAIGPPQAMSLGSRAFVETPQGLARLEIVGFRDGRALMMPFDAVEGLRAGSVLSFEPSAPTLVSKRQLAQARASLRR